MVSTSTRKEQQLCSKLKTIKKSTYRLISREHLDQYQQNFSCDDDVNDVVAKSIKKSQFTLGFNPLNVSVALI